MLALPGPKYDDLFREPTEAERAEREVRRRLAIRAWFKRYEAWVARLPDVSGLPDDDAWDVFERCHGDVCALCHQRARSLVRDHDHRTGHIRGLICGDCNRHAPSVAPHNPLHTWRDPHIARYCQYPPAAAMRLRCMYEDHVMGRRPAPDLWVYVWHSEPTGLERHHEHPFGRPAARARGYRIAADIVLNSPDHRCDYCPRRFDTQRAKSLHQRRCPDDPAVRREAFEAGRPLPHTRTCRQCGQRFKTPRGWRRHQWYKHGAEASDLFHLP
ncbi:MAG TPA: endonuclease domain-containing protein [Propionibacteriaceae bacterium]|nr:endonuclease domain-containing protein [Propionibacteriaceae bacterium]